MALYSPLAEECLDMFDENGKIKITILSARHMVRYIQYTLNLTNIEVTFSIIEELIVYVNIDAIDLTPMFNEAHSINLDPRLVEECVIKVTLWLRDYLVDYRRYDVLPYDWVNKYELAILTTGE